MILPQPHPDAITDWQMMKKEQRGAHQSIEDKAIEAYHNASDQGLSRAEAEKRYFLIFNNSYGNQKS